jgi:hypothetical protein
MARSAGTIVMVSALAAVALAGTPAALGAAGSSLHRAAGASLHGTVTAAGKPLGGAQVILFAGSRTGTTELGHGRSDPAGAFTISYTKPSAGVLYVQATAAGASRLQLRAVVGVGQGGGVPSQTLTTVTVNELTTVATAYALAQFSGANGISGPTRCRRSST